MRLLLRADATAAAGVGHAMRALSLAESAQALGHSVVVAGSFADVDWLHALLRDAVELAAAPSYADLAGWAAAEGFDALWVDDYLAADDLWTRCHRAGLLMINAEDGQWGRRRADIVLDASLDATATGRPADGSGIVLSGLDYALVRAAVRRARRVAAARATREDQGLEVLAVMGGTDAAGALPRVLAALVEAQSLSPGVPLRVTGVGQVAGIPGLDVMGVEPGPDLPARMAEADLVVSAAGTTMVELCCIGVAMAVVPVTANQIAGYQAFTDAGVALGLGDSDACGLGADAASRLADLLDAPSRREVLSRRAAALVDGNGAARLLQAVERLVGSSSTVPVGLELRPATMSDAASLLAWRNDPLVRTSSRMSGAIEPEAHAAWLAATLASERRLLYIVEDAAAQAVGSIRWDRSDDPQAWEVSIALAPHARGRGWGQAVLALGETALRRAVPGARRLLASVQVGNAASLRMFMASGYVHTGEAGGLQQLTRRL